MVGVVSGWMAVDNDPLQEVEYQRYGYVSDIFVSSKVRGKWLATKLLKSIEDHLREVGARRLRIGLARPERGGCRRIPELWLRAVRSGVGEGPG